MPVQTEKREPLQRVPFNLKEFVRDRRQSTKAGRRLEVLGPRFAQRALCLGRLSSNFIDRVEHGPELKGIRYVYAVFSLSGRHVKVLSFRRDVYARCEARSY